jgi:AraC-like DNA-binding protein
MSADALSSFDPGAPHYPDVDRTVIAAAREFAPGMSTGAHSHDRAQFVLAIRGMMVATTEIGTWALPPGYALWLPPGVVHDGAMLGAVSMRAAYLRCENQIGLPTTCRVVRAPPLLQEALVALAAEPPAYDLAGRGGHLAALILDEIGRAPAAQFALPLPADRRLRPLARRLIEDPGSRLDINGWADAAGVSRRTLTRLFRAQTGLAFAAWRCRLRLLRAVEYHAGGEPLAHAAARVGYNSVAAFQTMARRETGMDFSDLCHADTWPGGVRSSCGTRLLIRRPAVCNYN